jgi:Mg2+ and Co2+ transporter CorA
VGRIETKLSQWGCRETEFGQRELFTTDSGHREQRDKLEYFSAIITISSEEISGSSRRISGLLQHAGATGSRRKEQADKVTFTSTTVVTITIFKHPASRPARALSGGGM